MAAHISVQTASGTVPAMVWRASPLTLRIRTRFSNLLYRYMFSATSSRNTTGMVSSPPVTARLWPFMLRSWARKVLVSSWARMAARRSPLRASKARWLRGRARMLMFSMCMSPLTFSPCSGPFFWGLGALRSSSSSSSSMCWTSSVRVCFWPWWAVRSFSNVSISAVTAASCSWLPGSTSLMAVSSAASRVTNSASFSSSAASSAFLASMERRSISAFSMVDLLSRLRVYCAGAPAPGLSIPRCACAAARPDPVFWRTRRCPHRPGRCRGRPHTGA